MLEAADAAGTDEVCGAYVLGAHVCVCARERESACMCLCLWSRAREARDHAFHHFTLRTCA